VVCVGISGVWQHTQLLSTWRCCYCRCYWQITPVSKNPSAIRRMYCSPTDCTNNKVINDCRTLVSTLMLGLQTDKHCSGYENCCISLIMKSLDRIYAICGCYSHSLCTVYPHHVLFCVSTTADHPHLWIHAVSNTSSCWCNPSTSAASSDYWWWSGVKEGTLTQLL